VKLVVEVDDDLFRKRVTDGWWFQAEIVYDNDNTPQAYGFFCIDVIEVIDD